MEGGSIINSQFGGVSFGTSSSGIRGTGAVDFSIVCNVRCIIYVITYIRMYMYCVMFIRLVYLHNYTYEDRHHNNRLGFISALPYMYQTFTSFKCTIKILSFSPSMLNLELYKSSKMSFNKKVLKT